MIVYDSKMLGNLEEDSDEAEWNRESQWVSALAAGGARGEFEAEGLKHGCRRGTLFVHVQVDKKSHYGRHNSSCRIVSKDT